MSVHFYNPQVCHVCGRENDEAEGCRCAAESGLLPSLDEPEPGSACPTCGEPIRVKGYCGACQNSPDLPVELSPEAPHRLRRLEDQEEMRIREDVLMAWTKAFAELSPRAALWRALDEYNRQKALAALDRLGRGVK